MTKEELWRRYVAKNPSFEGDGNVTMSAKGLRKLFDQTWDMAFGSACGNMAKTPYDDILASIFKK